MFRFWGATNVNKHKHDHTSLGRTRSRQSLLVLNPHPVKNIFDSHYFKNGFKVWRDLSFLGRVQIAHHSIDGHGTNSESMKKYAELDFSFIKIWFFKGRCLWHSHTVEIQGL